MTRRNNPGYRAQVRIIGGQWRGSKLEVGTNPALRPTSDRVRETLFNWLAGGVERARCLDLFAGSGALGIEALSRGASHCDFVESDPATAKAIRRQLDKLGAGNCGQVIIGDALALAAPSTPWDLVFIDPPFDAELSQRTVAQLRQPGFLAEDGEIYVETAKGDATLDQGFPGFEIWRDKQAGDVRYALLRREQ